MHRLLQGQKNASRIFVRRLKLHRLQCSLPARSGCVYGEKVWEKSRLIHRLVTVFDYERYVVTSLHLHVSGMRYPDYGSI